MKGELEILIGIKGSGKSAYAKERWLGNPEGILVINRARIGESLHGHSTGEYFSVLGYKVLSKQMDLYVDTLIHEGLLLGKTVVVDFTSPSYEDLVKFKYWNVPTNVKVFDISLLEAIKKDVCSPNPLGDTILKWQYDRMTLLMDKLESEGIDFTPVTIDNDLDKNECVIFDIDGTLAIRGDRGPFDWGRVGEDFADDAVSQITLDITEYNNRFGYTMGYKEIIICTSRPEKTKKATIDWLNALGIPFDKIFFRRDTDNRPDWVVKEEMWRKIAEDNYIVCIFDDRQQVVRRARSLGLKVFNVEYNNF